MPYRCFIFNSDKQATPTHIPARFQIELSKDFETVGSGWSIRQITNDFYTFGNSCCTVADFFPFLSHRTWLTEPWLYSGPIPLIMHSSARAIIRALTCVPLAVAMTTASAWSASYSWNDTWMTTLWISEKHLSGWRNTARGNSNDHRDVDHHKLWKSCVTVPQLLITFSKYVSIDKNLVIHMCTVC